MILDIFMTGTVVKVGLVNSLEVIRLLLNVRVSWRLDNRLLVKVRFRVGGLLREEPHEFRVKNLSERVAILADVGLKRW
jgi:hypothetical protein